MLVHFKIDNRDVKLALRTAGVPDTPQALEMTRQYLIAECTLVAESLLFSETTDWQNIYEEHSLDIRPARNTHPRSKLAHLSRRDRSSKSDETIRFDGQRMRELRHQHGLSAKTLADLADIDMRHVYRLEAEKRPNVSAVVLARVAVALDVTLEYLLGLTDDCQTAWIL